MSQIEPFSPESLPRALAYLLATPGLGRPADAAQVTAFLDYMRQSKLSWEGCQIRLNQSIGGLFLALLLPGSTAIVMVPTPGELGIEAAAQATATRTGLEALRDRRLHYAQALVPPEAHGQRLLLKQMGFRHLAPLVYMDRDARYPWVEPPDPATGWMKFSDDTRPDFAATLLATYEASLDCPELTGLRPIQDVMAAHQASGEFDPALWELALIDGRPAGCLLLARLQRGATLEVVYMGVVPAFRNRGTGGLLVRRALQQCREFGARRLTLVVDDRNAPAKRLYARFALRPVARREAFLYLWRRNP